MSVIEGTHEATRDTRQRVAADLQQLLAPRAEEVSLRSTYDPPPARAFALRSGRAADGRCVTLSYMKTSTITIRLDDALERQLDQACARTGRTRSDLARDALRRQLALLRFERLRRRVLPLAESQGYLTDDDVFRDVS